MSQFNIKLNKKEICAAMVDTIQSGDAQEISTRIKIAIPRGGGANVRFCQIFPKTGWN